MKVMSNTYIENTACFSKQEIGSVRNAFLQYEPDKQVHLLTVMHIEEAVAIFAALLCRVRTAANYYA